MTRELDLSYLDCMHRSAVSLGTNVLLTIGLVVAGIYLLTVDTFWPFIALAVAALFAAFVLA